jgi:cyclic pyranopterin phosphate synthase
MSDVFAPLIDRFGRVHNNLRISVTDRCNIRCFYCMPAENVQFKPRHEILTFEEIERFVRIVARMGVNKLRLTGGEPLVRQGMPELVRRLVAVEGITEVALTTNGILLAEQAEALKQAGLHRLNISLDALHPETFRQITRRDGFQRVLEGIFAAQRAGFGKIKINAVAIAGITEDEVVPFGHFAREHDLEVRFIEFMPLDADGAWDDSRVLPGERIRALLEAHIGPLVPLPRPDPSQPAVDFIFADGRGRIGFINPVTEPFCSDCNRLRLTAEGKVRNCLFSLEEWDARALLRGAASDEEIAHLVRQSILAKWAGHGIHTQQFVRPQRAMYQIGG